MRIGAIACLPAVAATPGLQAAAQAPKPGQASGALRAQRLPADSQAQRSSADKQWFSSFKALLRGLSSVALIENQVAETLLATALPSWDEGI